MEALKVYEQITTIKRHRTAR